MFYFHLRSVALTATVVLPFVSNCKSYYFLYLREETYWTQKVPRQRFCFLAKLSSSLNIFFIHIPYDQTKYKERINFANLIRWKLLVPWIDFTSKLRKH
uniref:Secreted protein n=1 Tax=Heterorhabditis bacteriophora TaxID=37862 RepID=A0A1I7X3T9_HETBA